MRKSILIDMLVVIPNTGGAVQHPALLDPKIIYCQTNARGVPCAENVWYQTKGTLRVDLIPAVAPNPRWGTTLKSYGVHCGLGDAATGVPYSLCWWTKSAGVTPPLRSCQLLTSSSWELTASSQCTTEGQWGPYSGGGPGGECVVFAQEQGDGMKALMSIHGVLNADAVANSSNRFCQKALPPDVVCTAMLPQEIEHGNVQPTALSRASIQGEVSCGAKPVVGILGGRDSNSGQGCLPYYPLMSAAGRHCA